MLYNNYFEEPDAYDEMTWAVQGDGCARLRVAPELDMRIRSRPKPAPEVQASDHRDDKAVLQARSPNKRERVWDDTWQKHLKKHRACRVPHQDG